MSREQRPYVVNPRGPDETLWYRSGVDAYEKPELIQGELREIFRPMIDAHLEQGVGIDVGLSEEQLRTNTEVALLNQFIFTNNSFKRHSKDVAGANVFTALSVGLILQSDNPQALWDEVSESEDRVSGVFYEIRGGKAKYLDVFRVKQMVDSRAPYALNVPAQILSPKIRTMLFGVLENDLSIETHKKGAWQHNRKNVVDHGLVAKRGMRDYRLLLQIYDVLGYENLYSLSTLVLDDINMKKNKNSLSEVVELLGVLGDGREGLRVRGEEKGMGVWKE